MVIGRDGAMVKEPILTLGKGCGVMSDIRKSMIDRRNAKTKSSL